MKQCTRKIAARVARMGMVTLWVLSQAIGLHAKPVINELFFHPPSHGTNEEYIELYNTGPQSVDLLGWSVTKGVSYTFSNHWVLAPGQFLVVAADINTFSAQYPSVTAVAGPWTGTLANSGETVQLSDNTGLVVDEVRYADAGDFARRLQTQSSRTVGWIYQSSADGGGASLERIRATDEGTLAANWAASQVSGGSPGRANTRIATEVAPYLLNVRHSPALPRSSEPITITAEVIFHSRQEGAVQLFYRNVATPTPGPFLQRNLVDDGQQNDGLSGDGVFGVVLSPQTNRTVLEFFVQVIGADGLSRTWPPSALDRFQVEGQFANALLQVQNFDRDAVQPSRFLILSETDRRTLLALPANDSSSNAELNTTLIEKHGDDLSIRYGCGLRLRGASSRFQPPSNYRLSIPSDRRWKGLTAINLNAHTVHSQIAGYALATRAGLVTEEHLPVSVQINGSAQFQSTIPGLAIYAQAEVPNGDFAAHHFPLDPDGNLYRASSSSHNADLAYLGSNSISYVNVGYSKTTHQAEDDWSDLVQLTQMLANTNQGTYVSNVSRVVNIPQWLTYFAVFTLSGSSETSLGTGVGDDFAMYRGQIDPRFRLIGHDWDSVLGQEGGGPTDSIFEATSIRTIDAFLKHPEIAPLYFAELLRLLEGAFAPGEVARLLDQTLGSWNSTFTLREMKSFATNRFNSVSSQIPTDLRWRSSSPTTTTGSTFPRATSTNLTLFGSSHAARTRSVLVNGSPAQWSAWEARWSKAVRLSPGLNSILIQSLDASGVEFERTNAIVLLQGTNGLPLTGPLANNTLLTKESGPYRVTGTWEVPEGLTLTVSPGTTLLFDPDANLVVRGPLIASGTETQKIYFTRSSSAAQSNWGGIEFVGPGGPHRLSHVVLDAAGSQTSCLRATNVVLEIDHLLVTSTTRAFLNFAGCSLTLTDSVFPAVGAPALISGSGIAPSGPLLIARNTFNAGPQTVDLLRVSGGRRPGPILELIDNHFLGARDDLVELTDADAHIEGNLFANVRPELANLADLSAAVVVQGTQTEGPSVTLARNIFLNCTYGVLCRDRSRVTLQNNTFNNLTFAAVSFDEPDRRADGALPGAGALLENNIVWLTPTNLAFSSSCPGLPLPVVQARHNILSGVDIPANTTATLIVDPRLAVAKPSGTNPVTLRASVQLQPGSPALGAGTDGRDIGATVAPGIAAWGTLAPVSASSHARVRFSGAGSMRYRWSLDDGPLSDPTDLDTPLNLSALDDGMHELFAVGQSSAGRWDNTPRLVHSWRVETGWSRVVINEVLAWNRAAYADGESFPDMLELHNPGDQPISLEGVGLTDTLLLPHRFTFPRGFTLEAGQFVILFADSRKSPGLHTRFGLDAEGGGLYLFAPGGNDAPLLDEVRYGLQIPDKSIGRRTDGSWGLCEPTLGAPNREAPQGNPNRLIINEWLANGGLQDFLEVFNQDLAPVALAGLSFTDDALAYPVRDRVPPLSYIEGQGFRVWITDGQNPPSPGHLSFSLPKEGGSLSLHANDGKVIDCFLYQGQNSGISQGRSPSGATRLGFFNPPTPGAHNPAPPLPIATNVTFSTLELASLTNHFWRYRQDNIALGAEWRLATYDDSTWASGIGLFGVEDCNCLPAPIQTPLSLTAPDGQSSTPTYYFRTRVNLPAFYGSNAVIKASLLYDDGIAIYINGTEAFRRNLGVNPTHTTTAGPPVAVEGQIENVTLALSNFVVGVNLVAVEVHQSAGVSPDVLMGMSLRAERNVTNFTRTQGVVLNEILANNASLAEPDGSITDWVELYNLSQQEVDLSEMSLSDKSTLPRRWVIPEGTRLAGESRRVIRMDSSSAASTQAAEILNTGFGLSAQGDEIFLFDTLARNGTLIDSVRFGVQAANYSLGRSSYITNSWILNVPTPGLANLPALLGDTFHLRVNEWMASPTSGEDWFELYNPDPLPVSLGGLFLTDDLARRTQHPISSLSFLGIGSVGGYVQFEADGAPEKGSAHVPFKLGADGDTVALFHSDGSTPIDIRAFGPQKRGISEGRFPDGGDTLAVFPRSPTPGAANFLPFASVRINEIATHAPQGPTLELWNTTDQDLPIGGWWLSTDETDPKQFRIASHTTLAARGFLVFSAPDLQSTEGTLILDPLRTKTILLSAADTRGALSGLRNQVKVGNLDKGDGAGGFLTSQGYEFPILRTLTLGDSNTPPKVGPLVINEVYYHPPAAGEAEGRLEYIELHNASDSTLTLEDPNLGTNVWHLRNGVDFDLPAALSLPPMGFVVLVAFDPGANANETATFRARFSVPDEVPLLGPWEGQLDNAGDTLELNRPGLRIGERVPRVVVDKLSYRDLAPWPTSADGAGSGIGFSLQRRAALSYGNEATNWVAAVPSPGKLNGFSPVAIPSINSPSVSLALPIGTTTTLTALATGTAPFLFQWALNGLDIPAATNASLALTSIAEADAGFYTVRVSNPWGSAWGVQATIQLMMPPRITREPDGLVLAPGEPATMSVGAVGTPPLRFQWMRNQESLSGETRSLLALKALQPGELGEYQVIVSNAFGSTTSSVARVEVATPPRFLQQPQPSALAVNEGQWAQISASVAGSPPLRVQWRRNGIALRDATNAILTLPHARASDAGSYTLLAANPHGESLSTPAILSIRLAPVLSVTSKSERLFESDGTEAEWVILRSGSNLLSFVVNFALTGDAAPGFDFSNLVQPLIFPAESTVLRVPFKVLRDGVRERTEETVFTLLPSEDYVIGTPSTARRTVIDEDNHGPILTPISPIQGQRFPLPSGGVTVEFQAIDPDPGDMVTSVTLFGNGSLLLGSLTVPPYRVLWTNPPSGSNWILASASDQFGALSSSVPLYFVVNQAPVVTLLKPQPDEFFSSVTTSITVQALADDSDGSIASFQFLLDGAVLATVRTPPFSFNIPRPAVGSHVIQVIATDNEGRESDPLTRSISVGTRPAVFTDAFSTRGLVTGTPLSVEANNSLASVEDKEPLALNGTNSSQSVWIEWTAPIDGLCTADTLLSRNALGEPLDTVLAVYLGDRLDALWEIASDDDGGEMGSQGFGTSIIRFSCEAGVSYQFRITTYGGGPLRFNLKVASTPSSVPNGDAVEQPGWSWRTGGSSPWVLTTATTADGVDALRSGSVSDRNASWLETTIIGPAALSFRWRMSGTTLNQNGFTYRDHFVLRIGDAPPIDLLQRNAWIPATVILPAGPQRIRWIFLACSSRVFNSQRLGVLDLVNLQSLRLQAPTLVAPGVTALSVQGWPNGEFSIESSSNLSNWLPVHAGRFGSDGTSSLLLTNPAGLLPLEFFRGNGTP